MSSRPSPTSIFTPSSEAALAAAACDVAERSFFAYAEPCDASQFAALAAGVDSWHSAAVEFHEGERIGTVRCLLPADAALPMFDAFSGRGGDDPEPSDADLADLIGELANMVCGAWLTRAARQRIFSLRTMPVRVSPTCVPMDGETWTTIVVNDRPVAVAASLVSADELDGGCEPGSVGCAAGSET